MYFKWSLNVLWAAVYYSFLKIIKSIFHRTMTTINLFFYNFLSI